MDKCVIVKLDLCESKHYVDSQAARENEVRQNLLGKLHDFAKGIFPGADKQYPRGSSYSAQGDCIYIVLERPTVAVRCSIEFMKGWYGNVPALPDCRAVLDYGDIYSSKKTPRLELLGEPFENIAKMEKHFSSGQIGVTEEVVERTDNTLVQFIRPATIEITKKRKINTFLANYEDPRLIKLSSLAHALFIADPSGAEVRQKAVEAMIIESLFEIGDESMSFSRFSEWIRAKQIPEPSPIEFRKIGESSKYLRCDEQGTVCYETDTRTKIQSIQAAFDSAQEKAIINVAGNVAKQSGISEELVRQRIDIKSLIEEYLCSAFLQIRMMANYFRSTRVLFERLSTYKELDYIILKYFKRVAPDRPEEFIIFKRAFLEAVKTLAESNNVYIASIFHNVLLLYYLNRNSQLSRGQLAAIKEKEIYLDTNTLYAHVCKASNFNTALAFVLSKLHKLGAKVFLFDRSLIEYLGSLESTLHKYRSKSHYDFIEGGPWIWKEFISNVGRYRSDFEYCVALHKIPKDLPKLETDFFDRARQELRKINIELIRLEPFLDKDDLGGLYYKLVSLKFVSVQVMATC